MLNAGTRYAYIAPTFKQAKRIVWGMAKHYAQGIRGVKYNESELLITYPNGSEIMILGSDNPDSLRGIALWGVFLDEYPQQSPVVFTEIVTKCLADHLGYCIFGGTPKGKGHFYRVYKVAKENPTDWCLVYRTIDDSLEQEGGSTIENLKQALEDDRKLVKDGLMTSEEFSQEWYNNFEAAVRGAVYLSQITQAQHENRISNVPHDDTVLVYTVWDLGIGKSDAMSIGFYQRVGKEVRKIDYYENTGLGLKHYIKVVKDKPYIYGKHFAPHDIKHKEMVSGKTRLELAENLGIKFEVVPMLGVEDGIDLARSLWNRLWVDQTKCELWLDFIGQYHYEFDEKTGQYTSRPVHDFTSHGADEFRYAAVVEDQMIPDDYAGDDTMYRDEPVYDEFKGELDPEGETRVGFGKSPIMRGVNIGALGHKKPGEK